MKLNIDKPCTEDWNSMNIGMISRHCDVCAKGVHDFTNKSTEEILTFLLQNNNKSVCGRMRKSQLDFHHDELEIIIEGLTKQKNNKYAFAILSLACIAMVSCSQDNNKNHLLTQEKEVIENVESNVDTTIQEDDKVRIIKNKTANQNSVINNQVKNRDIDSLENELGIIDDIEILVMGDVSYSYHDSIDEVFTFVDKMPEFVGGIDSLFSFLSANVVYPEWEKKNNIQGKVYVSFLIEKDGSISTIKILRSVEDAKNFDKEVIRVMNLMPNWIPGENLKGEKVAVQYNLPFNFKLKD